MDKISKRLLSVVVSLLVFSLITLVFVAPADARSRRKARVLGATTSNLQIPPTAEGPGLVLPDSPLFFLDNLKQNTRLFLAFTPSEQAKIRTSIAGERLAELRFMLAKNNKEGIRVAIQGVSDNLAKAAENVTAAGLSGKDTSILARQVNNEIKVKQQALDVLENIAQGEIKALVAAAQESLMDSKIRVEESLSEDELAKEIQDDLNRESKRDAALASSAADDLRDDIEELNFQAAEAAQNSLKKREEAIKKALEEKNDALLKTEEIAMEAEKKKQGKILELSGKAAQDVKDVVEKAKAAAASFEKTKEKLKEVRSQSAQSFIATQAVALTNSAGSSADLTASKTSKPEEKE